MQPGTCSAGLPDAAVSHVIARILVLDRWCTHQLCTVLARHAWCNGHVQLEEACSLDACLCNGHLLEQLSCSLQCAACFCRPAAMSVSQSSVNCGSFASVARTQPDRTAPCFVQRPLARAKVLPPSRLHAAVLPPPCLPHNPPSVSGSTAGIQSAEPKGSMLRAETIFLSTRNAPINRAEPVRGVRIAANPSCLKDVAAAWSRSRSLCLLWNA